MEEKKTIDNSQGNAQTTKKDNSSNFFSVFFSAFFAIFKYAAKALSFCYNAIKKPFVSVFGGVSQNVDRVYKDTIVKPKQEADESNQGFFGKLWKLLNSDVGVKEKKMSATQLKKLEEKREALVKELEDPNLVRGDKSVVYVYKAKTKSGKLVTGRLYGFSKQDINAFLLNEGYEPFSIENNKMIDFLYGDTKFSVRKMKNKDLIFFLTQLSTYVKAGITLTEAMKIIMNQSAKNKSKLGIYQSIVYELTMGSSFSEAISKQGNIFPALLINMMKAAEATGELEETLDDMVSYYTDIESTRKEMISAMTYPGLITTFALGVVTFILMYVIPKFSEIYQSMEVKITGMTAFLLDFSSFLNNYILLILLIIIAIIVVIVMAYKKIKVFRKNLQVFFMKLPVFGNIVIYNEITIFSKTFSSLLKNNVNITESVDILSKITDNEIYKEIMFKTINNIAAGDRISEAFKDHWAVPEVAYYMIVTGESTGQLAEMMGRVAAFYQEQHKNLVNSLKSLIEPIIICLLAVIVGAIIISVVVPMFDMYQSLTLG